MNWTVYCMGDLPIFRDIINAVAMVFNSSLFNPSLGAGLVLVAMLISLLLFAMPVVMGKPLSPFPLLFVFMLFFGGIVPKVDLNIEDMFTGAGTTVSNVPIIVAVPAAIAASIARGITDKVETAFSSPTQGTSLSLGAEGFINPLKELLVFRKVGAGAGSGAGMAYYNANVKQFIRDCAVNSAGYGAQDMYKASDVIVYLNGLVVTGLITVQYTAANPKGLIVGCDQAKTGIYNDTISFLTAPSSPSNPSTLDKIANAVVPPVNNSPGGVASITTAYNNVSSQILGNAQNAQGFMVNMLNKNAIQNGLRCVNAASPAELASCDASYMIDAAQEGANIDAAGNASMYAKNAIPTMNILLALFYAFSPIIIGVALMSAAHGLKIIAGFLMFGAWTQSWMPISAVLNYMVQQQMQYEVSKFGSAGITIANGDAFYTAVSLKVGIASEMLAATPVISFGLLSGSMMAMSSVTGKFSKDRIDETHAAPGLGKSGGLADNDSLINQDGAGNRSASGGIRSDHMGNKANNVLGELSQADTSGAAYEEAHAHSKDAATQAQVAVGNAHSLVQSRNKGAAFNQALLANTSADNKHAIATERASMISDQEFQNLSESDQTALDAAIGFKMAGNGLGASRSLGTMSQKGRSQIKNESEAFKASSGRSFSEAGSRSFGKTLSTAFSSVLGNQDSEAATTAISDSEKAQDSEKVAKTLSSQLSSTTKQDYQAVGNMVNASFKNDPLGEEHGANQEINEAASKLSKKDQERFKKEDARMAEINHGAGSDATPAGRTAARLKALGGVSSGALMGILKNSNVVRAENSEINADGDALEKTNGAIMAKGEANRALAEDRTKNSTAKTALAANLKEQGGANVGLTDGFVKVMERQLNEAQTGQENLSTGTGALRTHESNHDKLANDPHATKPYVITPRTMIDFVVPKSVQNVAGTIEQHTTGPYREKLAEGGEALSEALYNTLNPERKK